MLDNTWVLDLELNIFSIVKTRAQALLNDDYPNTFWTMDNVVTSEPTFPTIYMFASIQEIGNDLIGQDINAVDCLMQTEIYVDKSIGMRGARKIAGIVMTEYKKLGFHITEIPNFDNNTADVKRMIFKATRRIGQADSLT